MREAAAAWWAWTAPLAVQAAAFAALVLVLDRLIERRAWPQLRLWLWLLAALRFLLPPTLASPVSVAAWILPGTTPAAAAAADVAAPGPTWLFAAWAAGVCAMSAIGVLRVRRIRAALRPEPAPARMRRCSARAARRLGLERVPRIVVSRGAPTAFVYGLRRPVVVVPADAADADLEPMLLHELAHVKRGDLLVDAGLTALTTVFWFHPMAWLVRRRVAHVREICCDATVAAALGPRAGEYRAALLRAAARLVGEPRHAPAFLGSSCGIVARLASLERGPSRASPARAALGGVLVASVAACVMPMGDPVSRRDAEVAVARRILVEGLSGTARPGCIRLHYAAMRIAADSTDSR